VEDLDASPVTDWLVTGGGVYNRRHAKWLVVRKVTHVINCSDDVFLLEDEHLICQTYGIKCFHNPQPDDGMAKPAAWFRETVRIYELAKAQDPFFQLYVHCAGGINRGPSNAYVLLRHSGFNAGKSERLIREARPVITQNHGLQYIPDAERYLYSR
jgi:protein-tyrosine phosphatase